MGVTGPEQRFLISRDHFRTTGSDNYTDTSKQDVEVETYHIRCSVTALSLSLVRLQTIAFRGTLGLGRAVSLHFQDVCIDVTRQKHPTFPRNKQKGSG